MRRLLWWLVPAALLGGEMRFARLGEFEGAAEVQMEAADPWQPARRNLPLPEGTWLRTPAGANLEIELDSGAAFRLGPDSLAEISDLSRLSTGQRITLLSLDHGLAYLTGVAQGPDSLVVAVPGAQMTITGAARLRLEADSGTSQLAVLEGAARFSSPAAELDLRAGQMVRVDPAQRGRFYLFREIPAAESDHWSSGRDTALAATGSASHVSQVRYGLADLDANGTWIEMDGFGPVWKPKVAEGWTPFREGKWLWYNGLGYTWVSGEAWGWLPYHYGRWMQKSGAGWFWVPGAGAVFEPGEVYWLRGTNLAGWGPLAPGEAWKPGSVPQLYLNANTTYARFTPEAREVDPAIPASRPKEPLTTATFVPALPSPALPAARLHATRPALRAGSTRVVPVLSGVTYQEGAETASAPEPAPETSAPAVQVLANPPAPAEPLVIVTPPAEPAPESYYPVPVYTGIVVVNPPERGQHHPRPRPPHSVPPKQETPPPATPPPSPPPAAKPPLPRTERAQEAPHRSPQPAPAPPSAEPKPIPRTPDAAGRPERSNRRNQ